jgi:hypothetical protein
MKSIRQPFLIPTRACGTQAEKLADFVVKFPSLCLATTADILVTAGVKTADYAPPAVLWGGRIFGVC